MGLITLYASGYTACKVLLDLKDGGQLGSALVFVIISPQEI